MEDPSSHRSIFDRMLPEADPPPPLSTTLTDQHDAAGATDASTPSTSSKVAPATTSASADEDTATQRLSATTTTSPAQDVSTTPIPPIQSALEASDQTAIVPLLPARPATSANLAPARAPAQKPLIIPGSYKPPRPAMPRLSPRRRHRETALIMLVTICLLITGILSVPDLRTAIVQNTPLNTFSAFAADANPPKADGYVVYRVRPADSIESIAAHFNVTIGGIYQLNNLYLGDEITVGQLIKIPNDAHYGANYQPTAPPIPLTTGTNFAGAPKGTIFGNCVFCAIAGYSTGGLCAPPSQSYRGFGLIQPDPNAKFIRGFSWYHNGVDLSTGQYGTPIVAAQDGQVIFAGWDPYGFGYAVKINHCWGLATSYGHMERILVHVGQFVHKGDTIGLQGSTGMSTGPHVHFMVWWQNTYVDPLQFYDHLGFPY